MAKYNLQKGDKIIDSKFKCGDKVWFLNVDKPISRYVYQISEIENIIWYVLTPKRYYMSTVPFYVDEKNLHKTKKDLLNAENDSEYIETCSKCGKEFYDILGFCTCNECS